jgi:uroporphyrin-3 C-methyltransferase
MKSLKGFASDLLYVHVDVAENEVMPFVMPKQQWYLRSNVKMAMLQAQVAVLQRQQGVFEDAVKQALKWLQYFNQTDAAVQTVKLTLSNLSTSLIEVKYPEQFASQKLVDNLLMQRLGGAYKAPVAEPAAVKPVEQTQGGEL